MSKIRVPKPFSNLMEELETREFVPLLSKYHATDRKGRYFHWDEFKWRVEQGDNEIAAWVATKIARQARTNYLHLLQAEKNVCFSYCIPDSLFAQLHSIDKMIGGGQQISDSNFVSSDDKHHYFVKSLMLEEAITSSQLEGASTTREVAQEMLKKSLAPTDKSQQMIFNNYQLMKKVIERKNEELSIEFILELHKIATYKAIDNEAISGSLRQENNIIVSDLYGENTFYPPDYKTIQSRLVNLCRFANQDHSQKNQDFIHPIIKAIILHFMVAYIHPFGDGNGRTARAIFYWSILSSGYWLFEYVSISKFIKEKRGAYDKAFIYTETDDFDLTYFLYNQIDTIEKAIKSLHEYIDRKRQEFYGFMHWIDKNPLAKTLIRGHLEILKEALKSPGKEFTAKQVAIDFGVTENTARSYLTALVDKNLLVLAQSKRGKARIYIAPANLKARLEM
ncbi:Fic family protein [Pseudanabaena sp. FACHB-1998]|nr:Fic family protein [Pseudanabaena sp. FACHB-1998]